MAAGAGGAENCHPHDSQSQTGRISLAETAAEIQCGDTAATAAPADAMRMKAGKVTFSVMAGLVPAIHDFTLPMISKKAWMPGLKPAMTKMKYALALIAVLFACALARADAAFDAFLQSLWPDAQTLGVSRATFDAATRGLEPDLSLPDLAIPGRPETAAAGPARIRADAGAISARGELRPARRARPSSSPRNIATRWRASSSEFGVPGNVVLAIWARETDYGALQAAARRHPRAGDAGLCRQAQGFLPQRIPAGAEDAAGRHAARRHALVLGRRAWG